MLLGNPKKAVISMSIPMMIASIAMSVNNLIDAIWVSNLGPDALAAVGFVFPLFFILFCFGNGIGTGASSAISRHIGRNDKRRVDSTASQSVMMTIIASMIVTAILIIFQKDFLNLMGVGKTLNLCIEYGTPIYLSAIILLLDGLFINLLRSEGAAKRSMLSQIVSSIVNIILDPFFIYDYGLNLGMAGAAWATVVSVLFSIAMMFFWFFVKKDTYIKIRIRDMRLKFETVYDVLRVGFPASIDAIIISLFSIVINSIIVMADKGTDGLAIFSSNWRIVEILMVPIFAIGGAVVPIFGAAYGAKRYDKMKEAFCYSVKICTIISIASVLITFIAADFFVMLYAYSESVVYLKDDMITCLKILCLFLPFMPIGFVASGLFQSMGFGFYSLTCSIIRNGLQIPASWVLLQTMGTTVSITWGIISMEILGSVIGGIWGGFLLHSLLKKMPTTS